MRFRPVMSGIILAMVGVATSGSPSMAAEPVPHLEACTQKGWGFLDALEFRFGTVNTCDKPVANWFMARDGRSYQRTIEPGGTFRTDITSRSVIDRGWIFATCPLDHEPDIAFSDKNWSAISDSKYRCIKP